MVNIHTEGSLAFQWEGTKILQDTKTDKPHFSVATCLLACWHHYITFSVITNRNELNKGFYLACLSLNLITCAKDKNRKVIFSLASCDIVFLLKVVLIVRDHGHRKTVKEQSGIQFIICFKIVICVRWWHNFMFAVFMIVKHTPQV